MYNVEDRVVVETTFEIKLFNGLIKGKSKLNLKKFVSSLDTNLKNALVAHVLEHIGIEINPQGEFTIVNNEAAVAYVSWLQEKQKFKNTLPTKVINVLNNRFAQADHV